MTSLPEVLHNISDHTQTLFRVLGEPGLGEDFTSRLSEHMYLEEQENSQKLEELNGTNPSPLTRKLLDHSILLQKMMSDTTIPVDLKQEVLHHFMEEHQQWQAELGTISPEPSSAGQSYKVQESSAGQADEKFREEQQERRAETNWTVGPMWQQGG